jgi:hypothetical protein
MINKSTAQFSWTVERNLDGYWELIYWPRGDNWSPQNRIKLASDNFKDAVNEGKHALYL